jgi:LysR family transcriptional regulator, low CO2-responsive transcriptional regulator
VFRDKRFVSVPFSEHPVLIFCSTSHRFARRRTIRSAELHGERLLVRESDSTTRKALEAALKAAKVEPEIVMEIGSREIIREAVVQGLGVAPVSEVEYVPGPGLQAVRMMVRAFYDVIAGKAPTAQAH